MIKKIFKKINDFPFSLCGLFLHDVFLSVPPTLFLTDDVFLSVPPTLFLTVWCGHACREGTPLPTAREENRVKRMKKQFDVRETRQMGFFEERHREINKNK